MTQEQFETFWSLYDNKIDRAKSQKKFLALDPKLYDQIISGVEKYKTSRDYLEGFKMGPYKFLHNERWNDDWKPFTPSPAQNGKTRQNTSRPQSGQVSTTGSADLIV